MISSRWLIDCIKKNRLLPFESFVISQTKAFEIKGESMLMKGFLGDALKRKAEEAVPNGDDEDTKRLKAAGGSNGVTGISAEPVLPGNYSLRLAYDGDTEETKATSKNHKELVLADCVILVSRELKVTNIPFPSYQIKLTYVSAASKD